MSKTEEITPPVAARDAAGPPQIDERYRIEKEIGRGGMGRVFVAHDRKLGRDVAIKVLASGMHGEEALRRFEREARATCARSITPTSSTCTTSGRTRATRAVPILGRLLHAASRW